ncbi:MAG: hypothetical protein ACOX4U_03775 [Anaerovoracaceae bacterium]|jgi:hypothetical protein
MDWTKAKTILIIALLVANIFLIVTYGISRVEPQRSPEERQADTISLLEKRNIFIQAHIPEDKGRMPVLTVEYDSLDQRLLLRQMQRQIRLPAGEDTDEAVLKKVQQLLMDCGIWNDNVVFDKIMREGDRAMIYYKNLVEGILLEDSYIACTFEGGRVTSLSRYWLKPVKFGSAKQETIPATVALLHFMSKNKKEDLVYIEKMEMVYWLDSASIDTDSPILDTARPAWKITYNSGKVVHIDAYE